jgi:histidine triad (HIT) family protein
MDESIFTKIINGTIPCYKIFEDDLTIAFLDIHPIQPGHVLVVPKMQIDHFDDLPDDIYQAVWRTVKKVAKTQKLVLKTQRIGLQVVGLDVPHAHVHVIPFSTLEEYKNAPDIDAEPNHDELRAMANILI